MSSNHSDGSSKNNGKGVERREFLKGAAVAAGAAMLGPNIIACSDDEGSGGGDQTNGTLEPLRRDGSNPLDYIDNVVILQMENRSFDHYFASYAIDEGRTDILAMPADTSNPMIDGTPVGIDWLDGEYLIDPDPPHMWDQVHRQWNNGANDGFVSEYEKVMDEDLERVLIKLNDYNQRLRDEHGVRTQDPEYDAAFEEHFGEELRAKIAEEYPKRLGWAMGYYKRDQLSALYTLADNFTLCDQWYSSVLGPTWPNRNYSLAATSMGVTSNGTGLTARTPYYSLVKDHGYSVGLYAYEPFFYFGMTVADFVNKSNDEKHPGLGLKGKPLDRFFEDCEHGTLPNVSVVEPDYSLNDDHPPQDVRLGQSFIASVYEALRKSPQWERTLLVVYYDEHGGFYDHVAPPKVENDDHAEQGFDQLGFRVPGILAGPLVKRGHVMKNVVDHASVPGLISRIFDVDHVNKRSETAGTFDDAFDIELIDAKRRPTPPTMSSVDIPHAKIRQALTKPYGQPELYQYCRNIHGKDLPSLDQQLKNAEAYFGHLERLRVARVY